MQAPDEALHAEPNLDESVTFQMRHETCKHAQLQAKQGTKRQTEASELMLTGTLMMMGMSTANHRQMRGRQNHLQTLVLW